MATDNIARMMTASAIHTSQQIMNQEVPNGA